MADALVSGFNIFAGTWLEASGPAQIELITIDWLRQACGLPETAGGLFVSGGSMANLTALLVARRVKLKDRFASAVIYYSDQTHSSIERALKVMGMRKDQIRKVKTDERFRINFRSLREMVESDKSAGLFPFCVVANAGTTNTGAVDPLFHLARYCQDEGLWFHVDGAYGAAAVLCDRGKKLLDGLSSADSLSLDPHKWLFQPYEIGCVLVRQERWLEDTFHILPEYLADIAAKQGEVNFCDRGVQLTRMFRALKLWMTIKVFGRAGIRSAIDRGFELAEFAEELIRGLLNWEVVTPAQMGVITFRYNPPETPQEALNHKNQMLVDGLMKDGTAMLSTTNLRGNIVLRMCTINPRTTEDDIFSTIHKIDELTKRLN
jgi:glutamate/tyrosine decarboxylase-like PLP-dependent enzyme